jgi:hypothetical protein
MGYIHFPKNAILIARQIAYDGKRGGSRQAVTLDGSIGLATGARC